MKLYYYRCDTGNFGDDLNPWLWGRLIPEFLNDDACIRCFLNGLPEVVLVFVTLMSHHCPRNFSIRQKLDDVLLLRA